MTNLPSSSPLRSVTRIVRRLGRIVRPDVEVHAAPTDIVVDWNVAVPVRDGTILRVNVFRPAGGGPVPVIMSAHPYGKDRIPFKTRSRRGLNPQYRVFVQPHRIRISAYTSWEAPDPAFWVPRGYAVINADLRGGGTSAGVDELLSDQEAHDYYDLIEWAGVQPWSSGRVGLDGVSYLAISQYKVAALKPPHLAAICPWEGFSDLYRDFARPGGVREDGFSIMWSNMTRLAARVRGNLRREIVARPERDDWYRARTPHLEGIAVPILVCGSFSDHSLHSRGSFEAFRRAGSAHKYLYTHRGGKWSAYYGADAANARARFFDVMLKGQGDPVADLPRVRLAVYDGGPEPIAVTHESAWPPTDLEPTVLALDARTRTLQPASAERREALTLRLPRERVSFMWTASETIDIIGSMMLRLYLELPDGGDAAIFAGVRKFRAGREVTFEGSFGFSGDMISKGWHRLAHRRRDEALSTPELPVYRHDVAEPLQPGEIVAVDIALLPHATRLCAGDVLRVDLRGDWHYARDPFFGQFPTGYQRSREAACTLHTGGAYDAHLAFRARPA